MSIFLAQDYDTTCEISQLATEANCFISSQASKPNLCVVQDSLIAAFLMTRDNSKITKELFYNITCVNKDWTPDFVLGKIQHIRRVFKELGKPIVALNGKGLFSLMLPDDLYYTKRNNATEEEPIIRIHKGVVVEGVMNKAILGASHNSLLQIIAKEYSEERAMQFIDHVQWVTNEWLVHHGFGIGIKDCITMNNDQIQSNVIKGYMEANQIKDSTSHPAIKEARISCALSKAKDIGMKIAKDSMKPDNGFITAVASGAKGDFFNICQITGLLGQQNICGQRVPLTFNKGKRSLPYYDFELNMEDEYESRGFIRSSFIKGLNPREFFFHAMSGREGVSDSAMKTATTGYTMRKMIKILEDSHIKYDSTLRNVSNQVISWAYGDDNFDRSKMVLVNDEPQFCDIGRMAENLNQKYKSNKSK